MNKLAVFVEGYTELLFIDHLISEIIGAHDCVIEHMCIRGGRRVKRTMSTIGATKPCTGERYYIMIVDCGGDNQVGTRVLEEHNNLTQSGYDKIIALRDVGPTYTISEINLLENGLKKYMNASLIPVNFILAVMEVEAWFVAECAHFRKISSKITIPRIISELGFNPEDDDLSLRVSPSSDIENIYMIGGEHYVKGTTRTVDALDYCNIYVELINKIPYLKSLIEEINDFMG